MHEEGGAMRIGEVDHGVPLAGPSTWAWLPRQEPAVGHACSHSAVSARRGEGPRLMRLSRAGVPGRICTP